MQHYQAPSFAAEAEERCRATHRVAALRIARARTPATRSNFMSNFTRDYRVILNRSLSDRDIFTPARVHDDIAQSRVHARSFSSYESMYCDTTFLCVGLVLFCFIFSIIELWAGIIWIGRGYLGFDLFSDCRDNYVHV